MPALFCCTEVTRFRPVEQKPNTSIRLADFADFADDATLGHPITRVLPMGSLIQFVEHGHFPQWHTIRNFAVAELGAPRYSEIYGGVYGLDHWRLDAAGYQFFDCKKHGKRFEVFLYV